MANLHRPRGTGKRTKRAWQERYSIENGSTVPITFNQQSEEVGLKNIDPSRKSPINSRNLHISPTILKDKPAYSPEEDLGFWVDDENKLLKATAEVLDKASDIELAKVEEEIETKFSAAEKRFIETWLDDYKKELLAAKKKRERRGAFGGDWIDAFRESFINRRIRWGFERQIAPEKAELLEKYLELKLPVEIPEEEKNDEEVIFTPEQSSKLTALIREVRKIQDKIKSEDLSEIIEEIIREDLIAEGIFSEKDFEIAFQYAIKWIKN